MSSDDSEYNSAERAASLCLFARLPADNTQNSAVRPVVAVRNIINIIKLESEV